MPSTELRKTVLTAARRIVVKLGTQLLTGPDGNLDMAYIQNFAEQVVGLRGEGIEVTVVSSGAIGAGRAQLRLDRRPHDVAQLQAVAAVGQPRLMMMFHAAFINHGIEVAQLLLTRSDLDDRVRFLNFRNCIAQVHRMGCVPILNENDSVAVDEIRFGDNDLLASLTCSALSADALIILTVVPGLLDDQGATIDLVDSHETAAGFVRNDRSALGTGGIATKLAAAKLVTDGGNIAVIANGREPGVLSRLLNGDKLGTVFVPSQRKAASRKRWIGLTRRPAGRIVIDGGATRAIREQGKSLLASGITAVEDDFARGGVIAILDATTREVARGLTNYSAEELRLIMGHPSSQFSRILGREAYDEVIHRDNLFIHPA